MYADALVTPPQTPGHAPSMLALPLDLFAKVAFKVHPMHSCPLPLQTPRGSLCTACYQLCDVAA